ncbi:M48 family metallopeptidase [Akkermansiaceae bacterium]|nr:M48 family metallopeptidase [Akkermansiaceae bacterium]
MKPILKRCLSPKSISIFLPVAIISCAAPTAFNSKTGAVAMAPSSASIQKAGRDAFNQHRRKTPISADSYARARVNRVASRLKPVVNLPGTRWEFEVFNDSSANAFAVPGGKVGVNTGLLKVAVTDGQLAAVLAHEMAHVTSNHAQARIQNNQTIATGAALIGVILGQNSSLGKLAPKVGNIAFGLTFSRQQELEADKVGTIFMARAGYNPEAAVELWKRMAAQGNGGTPEFLSTHPVSATRIKALQDFLPQAKAQQR